MYKIVLLRHGESEWNKLNLFTGWTDVDLTETGVQEAKTAGKLLKEKGYTFDLGYSSFLKRANKTLNTVLEELDLLWIPVEKTWRLNERHYGALQGMNKTETAEKYGEEQVKIWRRSYDVPPMALESGDKRLPELDKRYSMYSKDVLPRTECLKDTVERVLPYWHENIVPQIKQGRQIIIGAHGNSLRALVKYLDNLTEAEVLELNIPTAQPLVYELDSNLKPLKKGGQYLADPSVIQAAINAVANQGKK